MEQITIQGHSFNVPTRYREGHELNEAEANALNQTFHENLRNNFAKKVKEAGESPDLAALQAELDAYAESYQFGIRAAGTGVSRDPVMTEAMRMARKIIDDLLRKKGKKPSDVTAEAKNDAAKRLLERPEGANILAAARQRIEEQKALSVDSDDLLAGLSAPPAEATDDGQSA